jgi:hypothetical protein
MEFALAGRKICLSYARAYGKHARTTSPEWLTIWWRTITLKRIV